MELDCRTGKMPSEICLAGIIRFSISAPILRFIILRSNWVCRFSQNWASIPKYLSSLNAVSAVMALFPFTISLILLGGTERSLESWFMLIPKGFKKSSRRISPGVIGSRLDPSGNGVYRGIISGWMLLHKALFVELAMMERLNHNIFDIETAHVEYAQEHCPRPDLDLILITELLNQKDK